MNICYKVKKDLNTQQLSLTTDYDGVDFNLKTPEEGTLTILAKKELFKHHVDISNINKGNFENTLNPLLAHIY